MKPFRIIILLAAMAGLLVTSQALATNVNDLIVTGANSASDENREYLIDRVGTTVGQLDVGDSFRGLININTVNSAGANIGGLTGTDELTAVFQVLLVAIVPVIDGAPTNLAGTQYIFAPDPAFTAIYGPGAIAALFVDPNNNFAADFDDPAPSTPPLPPDDGTAGATVPPSSADVSVGPYLTEEAFIATATDGLRWATIGFLGLPGEGIQTTLTANGFNNVLTAFNLTSGTSGASGNLFLNLLTTGPAWDPNIQINRVTPNGQGGFVDFALSQQLRGVFDLNTPFEVSSNTNISFNATVIPEPSTMVLLGAGLLGLGALGVFRKREK